MNLLDLLDRHPKPQSGLQMRFDWTLETRGDKRGKDNKLCLLDRQDGVVGKEEAVDYVLVDPSYRR